MNWEIQFLEWIQENIVSAQLTPIMEAITGMGNFGLVWIISAVALLIFPKTRKYGVVVALALVINAVVCNGILKEFFARPRPFTVADVQLLIAAPGGYSFPSGHTSASFAAATAIYYWNRKVGVLAIILASLIAFSRMYFFVHYPTDILAGVIVGVAAAYVADIIVRFFYKKRRGSKSGRA